MIGNSLQTQIPPIGYSPAAYRAYIQMSHRKHLLVRDACEKTRAGLGLEELAGEIEQEIDVDIDNAEFFLVPEESLISSEAIDRIYAYIRTTSSANKLVTFDDLAQSFPGTPLEYNGDKDNGLESRILRLFRQVGSNGVQLPQPAAVRYYLLRHQDLIDLLPRIIASCVEQFDGQAQLSLEFYSDPEVVDSYLTIYVRQNTYSEGLLGMIRMAREQYSQLLTGSSGWIHLTTDFDSPR